MPVVRRRVSIDCSENVEPSQTKQAFKDECDINRIMAKYQKTGVIDFSRDVESGVYADLGDEYTFHAAMNVVSQARESFEALPSSIRQEFNHDPAEFLAFINDPKKNAEKAVELGLATRRDPPPPKPPTLEEVMAHLRESGKQNAELAERK